MRITYKKSLTKDEYSVKTVISSSKCSLCENPLVAHEIGHGVYKLQHTFDYDGLVEKKAQTDNIMDYIRKNGNFT